MRTDLSQPEISSMPSENEQSTDSTPPAISLESANDAMLQFRKFIIVLLSLLPMSLSADKATVATVNMQKLFNEYHVAVEKRGSIESLGERLKEDPRLKQIAETRKELEELQKKLRSPSTPTIEKESLFKKFQSKSNELKSLKRDTQQHIETEQAKINTTLVKVTRELLEDIRLAISEVAEKEGYQLVLESEGNTSSQLPTLLYIRNGEDITSLVLSHLNKEKPDPSKSSPNTP